MKQNVSLSLQITMYKFSELVFYMMHYCILCKIFSISSVIISALFTIVLFTTQQYWKYIKCFYEITCIVNFDKVSRIITDISDDNTKW